MRVDTTMPPVGEEAQNHAGCDRYRLTAGAPADLQRAAYSLRAGEHECERLVRQMELWRALATDTGLARLGSSNVGLAVLTTRDALLDAIVLGISRMVDDGADVLNVLTAFNTILRHKQWLRNDLERHFTTMHVTICSEGVRTEAETADLERMVQQHSAREATADFDQRLDRFLSAKRRFTSGDAKEGLSRLRELRHKQVAHNLFEVTWAGARPKVRDLDLVFHALRDLMYNAVLLCTGSHVDMLHDGHFAKRTALCFSSVLRPETEEERIAARKRAEAPSPAEADSSG